MSEQVIRHRGGGRDEDGKWTLGSDVSLTPIGIAPGGAAQGQRPTIDQGREGEILACTVYFPVGTDIVNSDEITVRGERFNIIVNDWLLAGRGGLEVLCTRGQG